MSWPRGFTSLQSNMQGTASSSLNCGSHYFYSILLYLYKGPIFSSKAAVIFCPHPKGLFQPEDSPVTQFLLEQKPLHFFDPCLLSLNLTCQTPTFQLVTPIWGPLGELHTTFSHIHQFIYPESYLTFCWLIIQTFSFHLSHGQVSPLLP